jgi:hypothetical protein
LCPNGNTLYSFGIDDEASCDEEDYDKFALALKYISNLM